jgi:AraC-like DNA-binding protein
MGQEADSRPFDVDLRVPYADARRNDSLEAKWRRASQDVPPPPGLRLPTQSDGYYAVRIRKYSLLDLVVEDQYSDAVIGLTGAGTGHVEGTVAVHFTFQGRWSFTSGHGSVAAGPTEAFVRWNNIPWEFEVAHRTRALALVVPARELNRRGGGGLFVSQKNPSAHLLLAHLKNCIELGEFGIAARNATIELFQGLIGNQVVADEHLSAALVRAAKEYIEVRLVSDPDINAESIAHGLHVSKRTLQRAFSSEGSSVMTYVRARRLERARNELFSTAWTVSELAARWHFTDSSHFIRACQKRFGQTPAVLRRTAAATPDA